MAGVPAYDRPSTIQDVKALLARGMGVRQVAATLGISKSTVYRILQEANP